MHRKSETKRLKKLMYKSSSAHVVRECGGCTACCTVMAVKELGKGMYRTCEHADGRGCSTYPGRPSVSQRTPCAPSNFMRASGFTSLPERSREKSSTSA